MPKHILEFQMPEESSDFEAAVKGMDAHLALEDIANEVFRPARKHGYSDGKIQELLDKCGESGEELVGALEVKFWEILSDRKIQLFS